MFLSVRRRNIHFPKLNLSNVYLSKINVCRVQDLNLSLSPLPSLPSSYCFEAIFYFRTYLGCCNESKTWKAYNPVKKTAQLYTAGIFACVFVFSGKFLFAYLGFKMMRKPENPQKLMQKPENVCNGPYVSYVNEAPGDYIKHVRRGPCVTHDE